MLATAIGWIVESKLPSSVAWLNPARLIGVWDMTFDLLFMLRELTSVFVVAYAIFLMVMIGRADEAGSFAGLFDASIVHSAWWCT